MSGLIYYILDTETTGFSLNFMKFVGFHNRAHDDIN
jgi:hypothetical protein